MSKRIGDKSMVGFSLNHWLLIGCPIVQAVQVVFMRRDNISRKSNIFCFTENTTRQVRLPGQLLWINDLASSVHGQKLSRGMDGLWRY
jgi:hypothetical protein